MCGRYATRSGKGNQPLNIKTAVERPILKLGLPNFIWIFKFYNKKITYSNLCQNNVGYGGKKAVVGGDLYFYLFIIKIKEVYCYD